MNDPRTAVWEDTRMVRRRLACVTAFRLRCSTPLPACLAAGSGANRSSEATGHSTPTAHRPETAAGSLLEVFQQPSQSEAPYWHLTSTRYARVIPPKPEQLSWPSARIDVPGCCQHPIAGLPGKQRRVLVGILATRCEGSWVIPVLHPGSFAGQHQGAAGNNGRAGSQQVRCGVR